MPSPCKAPPQPLPLFPTLQANSQPRPPRGRASAHRERVQRHLTQGWAQLTVPHRRRAALVAVLALELALLTRVLA
jgi:hypothetical protein